MSSAVTDYVRELHRMRHGTAELARYTPLINLLNEIGRSLRPKVRAEDEAALMNLYFLIR